jgi:uncharacterized linocin/CFP29 family protein
MSLEFVNLSQGIGSGDVADKLLAANMDHNVLRPFIDSKGRNCISIFNGFGPDGKPRFRTTVTNTPATLMKDQWIQLDEAVVRAARPMLRVWGDLTGAGLTYNIPNGMSVTVIQHQSMTDAGEATLSMDGLRQTNRDRVLYDLVNLPLPIVHSDFSFSLREIMVSRGQRLPLDTTMVEQATRKCVEQVEKLTLGTTGSYSYGGGTVYGLTNFPARVTKTITLPTDPGWTPETLVNEVLDMVQSAQDIYFNGPYGVWVSPGWTKYLDADYSSNYGGKTLRQRLSDINDIRFWRKADYLSGFQILLVQLTPDVIQTVTGMRLQTLQWDSHGGLQKNFKIMGIMVPRLKSNSDGNTGIVHATAA